MAVRERFWTAALTDERYRENCVAVAERNGELIGIAMSGPPLDAGSAWARQLYVLRWDAYTRLEYARAASGSAAVRVMAWPGSAPRLDVTSAPFSRDRQDVQVRTSMPFPADQGPDPPALPACTRSGGEMPVRSRCGTGQGSGSETALAPGAGLGWRGLRSPAPPPRPR
jgi:hypothetical protein